jgi:hypothetical protein
MLLFIVLTLSSSSRILAAARESREARVRRQRNATMTHYRRIVADLNGDG